MDEYRGNGGVVSANLPVWAELRQKGHFKHPITITIIIIPANTCWVCKMHALVCKSACRICGLRLFCNHSSPVTLKTFWFYPSHKNKSQKFQASKHFYCSSQQRICYWAVTLKANQSCRGVREERRNIPASIPDSNTIAPHLNAAPSPAAVASSFNHPQVLFLSLKCKTSKDETDLKVERVTNPATAWTWVWSRLKICSIISNLQPSDVHPEIRVIGWSSRSGAAFIQKKKRFQTENTSTDGRCSPAAVQLLILGGALTLMRRLSVLPWMLLRNKKFWYNSSDS